MFPCIETKVKWDEYGLLIDAEDYSFAQDNRGAVDDVWWWSRVLFIDSQRLPYIGARVNL